MQSDEGESETSLCSKPERIRGQGVKEIYTADKVSLIFLRPINREGHISGRKA